MRLNVELDRQLRPLCLHLEGALHAGHSQGLLLRERGSILLRLAQHDLAAALVDAPAAAGLLQPPGAEVLALLAVLELLAVLAAAHVGDGPVTPAALLAKGDVDEVLGLQRPKQSKASGTPAKLPHDNLHNVPEVEVLVLDELPKALQHALPAAVPLDEPIAPLGMRHVIANGVRNTPLAPLGGHGGFAEEPEILGMRWASNDSSNTNPQRSGGSRRGSRRRRRVGLLHRSGRD
jgi:hypothetical protein